MRIHSYTYTFTLQCRYWCFWCPSFWAFWQVSSSAWCCSCGASLSVFCAWVRRARRPSTRPRQHPPSQLCWRAPMSPSWRLSPICAAVFVISCCLHRSTVVWGIRCSASWSFCCFCGTFNIGVKYNKEFIISYAYIAALGVAIVYSAASSRWVRTTVRLPLATRGFWSGTFQGSRSHFATFLCTFPERKISDRGLLDCGSATGLRLTGKLGRFDRLFGLKIWGASKGNWLAG